MQKMSIAAYEYLFYNEPTLADMTCLNKGVGGQNINHKVTQPTASLPPRVILMNHNKPYQLARATFVWSRPRLRVQLSCRLKI